MRKKEANFQTKFNHWVKEVYKKTAAFELKQTTENALPFSDVVKHQIDNLLLVKEGTFTFKIPDCGYENPFDSFCMTKMPAYVVIYYKRKKSFHLISIETFILESKRSKRRSLTAERAEAISTISVSL